MSSFFHRDATLCVLVADDHAMVVEMFGTYLGSLPGFEVETAPDLHVALEKIEAHGPFDLVLLDLNMPGMNGLEGLRRALSANGDSAVCLLTSKPSPAIVKELIEMGAAGVVLKTVSLKALANEIRFMASGGRYIPVELLDPMRVRTDATSQSPLSARETEVLELLSEGLSNKDIGTRLTLAEATIKMHVRSICSKIGAANRTQAVILATEEGIL
ncbi:response regulator transcription factor [Shimia aestuarii]|uniref:response regulator transcription factor n=1 Tax=Shimia aestuarii TaxID=254406 RepID=UPI001FB4A761|nr:response regulator transcription factor [Shimia aestuarii]